MYNNAQVIILLISVLCLGIIVGGIIIWVFIHLTKSNNIEYRYIPRTFKEEQEQPIPVSEIFESMFEQSSPWIQSIKDYDEKKQIQTNDYFISQV